jgi:hypothetical protein
MKSTANKKKRAPEPRTGLHGSLRIKFGEIEIPRIKLPWATENLDAMPSAILSERMMVDIEELVARAVHLSVDRWASPPPADLEREMSAERAEEDRRVRKFIEEGVSSANAKRRKQVETLRSQLVKMERAEAQRAALELARIGQAVASWLEYLADERLDLIKPVARRFPVWPFNLGMSKEKRGGRRDLLRAKLAKKYRSQMGLGLEHHQPGETSPKKEGKSLSPYRLAAERVFEFLRTIRAHPRDYLPHRESPADSIKDSDSRKTPIGPVSPWVKRLFELREPMTTANCGAWWKVARVYIVEQWRQNQDDFPPLIRFSELEKYLKPPANKPGGVKAYIIDKMLKRDFETLAIPAPLE